MTIYLKITTAMLLSAGLIEANGWLDQDGYGEFVMAFVYAGMLLAGAFYFVSAADKYLNPKKIIYSQKQPQKPNANNQTRKYQPLYKKTKAPCEFAEFDLSY